jgi:methylase of polypeptide subunit release factors
MNLEILYKDFEKSYLKVFKLISSQSEVKIESPIQCCNYIFCRFLCEEKLLSVEVLDHLKFQSEYDDIIKIIDNIKSLFSIKINEFTDYDLNIFLGRFFEKYITKKESGAYYTPVNVVDYINENVILSKIIKEYNLQQNNDNIDLDILIKSNLGIDFLIKNCKNKNILKSVISNLSIIDISVGSGNFLFNAYYLLKRIDEHYNLNLNNIITENLYGIDIDQEAINLLKFRWCIVKNFKSLNFKSFNLELNYKVDNPLVVNSNRIFNNKKFDVVLGNPPYLEYSKVKSTYQINVTNSLKCGNLYAFILEKSLDILKEDGHYGFIIPISFVSTKRMSPIRNYFINNSDVILCSNFSDRPGCLFNGVHQKLSILIGNKQKGNNSLNRFLTTDYLHWYSNEINELFKNISYYESNLIYSDFSLKVGSKIGNNILNKVSDKYSISLLDNTVKLSSYITYLNMRMTFWAKSFFNTQVSKEYKQFNFKNELDSILFSAIVNSDLFFFVWESVSDVWHITLKDLNFIKINFDEVPIETKEEIKVLFIEFYNSLIENKVYLGSKQADYIYHHKKEKILIDKFSNKISELFGLNNEEIEYIRNYNLRFRMNYEYENYLKKLN